MEKYIDIGDVEFNGIAPTPFKVTAVSQKQTEIANIPWQVLACKKRSRTKKQTNEKQKKYIAIEVRCLYPHSSSNLWSCDVEIEVKVDFGPKESINSRSIIKTRKLTFDNQTGHYELFGYQKKYENDRGRFEPVTIQISAIILVRKTVGITEYRISTLRKRLDVDSEVRLRVGGQAIYCDKYALMCQSPVFRESLHDPLNELIILRVRPSTYITLLQLLHGQDVEITKDNVRDLIIYCTNLKIQYLIWHLEDFLIDTKTLKPIAKLYLAEEFKMTRLQEKVLETLTKPEIKKILENINEIGVKTTDALNNKLCELHMQKSQSIIRRLFRFIYFTESSLNNDEIDIYMPTRSK